MKSRKKKILLFSAVLIIVFTAGASPGLERDTLRKELTEVLSQEKFMYSGSDIAETGDEDGPLEKLLKKIGDATRALRAYLGEMLQATSYVAAALYIIIIALIGVLAYYLIRNIDMRRRRKSGHAMEGNPLNLDYLRELQLARKMAADAKYREALRLTINALWLFYNYSNEITYNKSRTNREYLELTRERDNGELLKSIVLRAEEAVYAGGVVSEIQFGEIYRDVEEIVT